MTDPHDHEHDPIGDAMAEAAAAGRHGHMTVGPAPILLYAPDGHLYAPTPLGRPARVKEIKIGGIALSVDDLLDLEPGDGVELRVRQGRWQIVRHRYRWWRFWGRCQHTVLREQIRP